MFIVEHLEPKLYKWCILEYKHISEMLSGEVMFTNVKYKSKLTGLGKVSSKRVRDLDLNNACILDPFASKELKSSEKFDYYIFGGILGDEDMQGRTKKELGDVAGKRRNLGKAQFSTDTAVYVAKHIIDGGELSDLKFKDDIEIEIAEGESVILPFRYVVAAGSVMLPEGFVAFLRSRKGF